MIYAIPYDADTGNGKHEGRRITFILRVVFCLIAVSAWVGAHTRANPPFRAEVHEVTRLRTSVNVFSWRLVNSNLTTTSGVGAASTINRQKVDYRKDYD